MENNYEKYDFKVDPIHLNGQKIEKIYYSTLTNEDLSFEIKSERYSKWGFTGNIYVEYQQMKHNQWVPSGITLSEADYYVYVLKDNDDNILYTIEIETTQFKDRIKDLIRLGIAKCITKDKVQHGSATKGILVPLSSLFITQKEIEKNIEERNIQTLAKARAIYREQIKNKK